MYGNREQLNKAIYMRDLVRHRALQAGGTPFGQSHADINVVVPPVYEKGSGRQLDQALSNRRLRRLKALYGLALKAFMKSRKGMPLTDIEKAALKKAGGTAGLVAWFSPQGIDVETAAHEGEVIELAPEEEVLAVQELTGNYLDGEAMGFGTILLIAGGVGLGIFLLGRMTG
jgi:hypothetical protein|tara:strand:- start:277 stop:792 length:516 start_codon:yes stop_codon:yes gene_type:complete